MAHWRGVLLLLLLAIGVGCAPPPPAPPPEVEYARCKAVLWPGPVCILPKDHKIHLWIRARPDAPPEIQVSGRQIDAAMESIQDGQWLSLSIPPGATRVDVLVAGREGTAAWSLTLREPASIQELRHFYDLRGEIDRKMLLVQGRIENRELSAAQETLQTLALPPEAPSESRLLAAYYRGVLAEKEGDYRSALEEVRKAAEIAERVKLDDYRRLAEEKLALLLLGVGRYSESAEMFAWLTGPSQALQPCDRLRLLNNQAWSALLAREAGGESFGNPAHLFEEALVTSEACKGTKPAKKASMLVNLALAHLQEGRLGQAKAFLARAREVEPHAPLPLTLWWLDLEARIARLEGRPTEALHLFGELGDLARETGSTDGRLRAAAGQAQSRKDLGDPAAALDTLRQAEALLDEQSLQIPVHEGRETFMATRQAIVSLHLEILLDQGRNPEAFAVARRARSRVLRQLAHADRLASLPSGQRDHWARLLAKYQERRAALDSRAKEDWRLPVDQRRHERAKRTQQEEEAKKLLDQAFLVLGDPAKELREAPSPPLRPGELILVYHPLSRGRWVGFAADGTTVTPHRFELPPAIPSQPTEELGRLLLHPFRVAIRKAHRIRILACGRLQSVDFHALPFDEDVLLARAPVVYGLDLPLSAARAPTPEWHALLVADPRDDLPGALTEARKVLQVLRSGSRPWVAEDLKGAEASAKNVRDRLAGADLLHYAGHGTFSGFGGWESSLLLAGETQLTLGDLLALERVPAWVVLSSCDTGRSSTEAPLSGLGLAQAFLLAGSREVVASTRPAADREVSAFFAELYQQWDREPDLAVALQRAQLSWRKRAPGEDWKGFRLFEP